LERDDFDFSVSISHSLVVYVLERYFALLLHGSMRLYGKVKPRYRGEHEIRLAN